MASDTQTFKQIISLLQKMSTKLEKVEEQLSQLKLNPIPDLPSFEGGSSIKSALWLSNCKGLFEANKIERSLWLAFAVVKLTGNAEVWYGALLNSKHCGQLNWDQFETAFRERWVTKADSFQLSELLDKWKWNDDLDRFYADCDLVRATVTLNECSDERLTSEFIRRLPLSYFQEVFAQKYKGNFTIQSWREALIAHHKVVVLSLPSQLANPNQQNEKKDQKKDLVSTLEDSVKRIKI